MVVTLLPSSGRPVLPGLPIMAIYQPWLTHSNRQARLELKILVPSPFATSPTKLDGSPGSEPVVIDKCCP